MQDIQTVPFSLKKSIVTENEKVRMKIALKIQTTIFELSKQYLKTTKKN